jgi:hypothetical protein
MPAVKTMDGPTERCNYNWREKGVEQRNLEEIQTRKLGDKKTGREADGRCNSALGIPHSALRKWCGTGQLG